MDNIPLYIGIVVSLGIALVVAVLVHAVIVPWQKRKIMGCGGNGKPKFTFGDSDGILECFFFKQVFTMLTSLLFTLDSSSNGSPRQRHKRPVSIVCDGKALPAITETTELVSLNNGSCSPHNKKSKSNDLMKKPLSQKPNNFFSSTTDNSTTNNNVNPNKFDPKIVKQAENLLGKHSLDNTDVTITSLNYIDEYQNTINNGSAITGVQTIQGYFDRKHSIKSPEKK